jgi:hypothetical protein
MVEIIRCVICIREGEWPSREQDVEEVDVEKLKEMVHVKDEDMPPSTSTWSPRNTSIPAHAGAAK